MSEEKGVTPEKKPAQPLKPVDQNASAPKPTFEERVRAVEDGLQALCEKHGVMREQSMDFPQYKILPPEVELALLILQNHKGNFIVQYKEVNDPKGEKVQKSYERSA